MSLVNEDNTRLRILADCRNYYGPEAERQLRMIFDKWDNLLKKCKNDEERKHIKVLAITEVHKVMGYQGGLSIGYKDIIDA